MLLFTDQFTQAIDYLSTIKTKYQNSTIYTITPRKDEHKEIGTQTKN